MEKKTISAVQGIKNFNQEVIIKQLPKKAQEKYDSPTPKAAKWGKWLSWGATAVGLINTGAGFFVGSGLPGISDQVNDIIAWSIPVTGFLGYLFDFFSEKTKDEKKK